MKAEFSDFIEGNYHREVGEIGPCDFDHLLVEARNLGGSGNVTLILTKSEKDFISIDYVGKNQYLVQSDRLCKTGSFLKRLLQSMNFEATVEGHAGIKNLAVDYSSLGRREFESKYS